MNMIFQSAMRSLLTKIPLVLCLTVSALVLIVWVRTYFVGDRYRWVEWKEGSGGGSYKISSIVTGAGGMNYATDWSTPTADPVAQGKLKQFLATGRETRPGYRALASPRYPLVVRESDDSILSSLGMRRYRFSNYSESWQVETHHAEIAFPFWAIFALTTAYPICHYVSSVMRRQREEQSAMLSCPRCGANSDPGATHCICCDRPLALPAEF